MNLITCPKCGWDRDFVITTLEGNSASTIGWFVIGSNKRTIKLTCLKCKTQWDQLPDGQKKLPKTEDE